MTVQVKVAVSGDLFTAFARLPKAQQEKVRKFIVNFERNPQASNLNYEKIKQARDPNMRSVRIDQAYRAIVLKPEQGNVYMLLWVDRHDDAYDWAARHECSINVETGALQVYQPQPGSPEQTGAKVEPAVAMFHELKDRQLVRMGIPEAMLGAVREIVDEEALDRIQERLPVEAYEALFLYMAGSPYEEIINEQELATRETVDTEDFATALDRAESRSRFVVVENELELEKMLNAPLERWRVFLHPSQRKLVERPWNGPVRVLGGAGTGKTVVALHRARWLAEHCLQGDHERILFTTFTRNLATDIEHNLRTLCPPELMQRIEVVNLDRWVARFLRKNKYEFRITYGRETAELWKQALDLAPAELGLPDAFYRDEWERVIQPQNVQNAEHYRKASRVGRGTTLRRAERMKIWTVFDEYRTLLNEHGLKEVDDAYRDAAAVLAHAPQHFGYRTVIVDEAQDMSTQAFRLLRKIIPQGANDMFIVGDGHQRIFGKNKVVLSRCDINIRGRSRRLRINYRTTEETRRWAVKLLEAQKIDDLDGGEDRQTAYRSLTHGAAPLIKRFDDFEAQTRFLCDYLGTLGKSETALRSTCLVTRTTSERDAVAVALMQADIPICVLERDMSDESDQHGVRLATMHRVKGLEFENILIWVRLFFVHATAA